MTAPETAPAERHMGEGLQFSSSGAFLDGPVGPLAVAPPAFMREGETSSEARIRANALMVKLAEALNAASALLTKIDDNPTLFFGMEDTCQDEFDELRDAIERLSA